MKGRVITEQIINDFSIHLQSEEKSVNTIEKYLRDVRSFATYLDSAN